MELAHSYGIKDPIVPSIFGQLNFSTPKNNPSFS
jgi:hypothetical protein